MKNSATLLFLLAIAGVAAWAMHRKAGAATGASGVTAKLPENLSVTGATLVKEDNTGPALENIAKAVVDSGGGTLDYQDASRSLFVSSETNTRKLIQAHQKYDQLQGSAWGRVFIATTPFSAFLKQFYPQLQATE